MKFDIWGFLKKKSVQKTRFSLKFDKSNGYFTWRNEYIYYNMSLNSPWNEKFCRQICKENGYKYFMFKDFYFTEISALCDMRKTALEPDRPQKTAKNGACLVHTWQLQQEYRHTLIVFNTGSLSTITIVARTPLHVMLHRILPVLLFNVD